MRVKSMLTVGFLSVMAAIAALNSSDSFAAAQRVDVIGNPNETVAQLDSAKTGGQGARVDIIDNIVSEGPVYVYTKPMSH